MTGNLQIIRRISWAIFFSLFAVLSIAGQADAQEGALFFSPNSGTIPAGSTFTTTIRVSGGGTAINAAEGKIEFDASKLEVASISKSGSIFTLWPQEPTVSNQLGVGKISFGGGIPSPGYNGSNGLVLTLTFRAKSGTVTGNPSEIRFVSGAVLANDGSGTNVAKTLGRLLLNATSTGGAPPPPPSGVSGASDLRSSTHPDQGRCYSNNDPKFQWSVPGNVSEVRILYSRDPDDVPTVRYRPPISERNLIDLNEGVSYFHARYQTASGLGPVTHFKFHIDTVSPEEFNITVTDNNSTEPKLTFESSDTTCGVDHYEIEVDGKEWAVVEKSLAGKPYTLIGLAPGEHQISVKAVDGAGNSTTAAAQLTCSGNGSSEAVVISGRVFTRFVDIIYLLFGSWIWLILLIIIILTALAHEFFHHSKTWRRFTKHMKNHDKDSDTLDLRK